MPLPEYNPTGGEKIRPKFILLALLVSAVAATVCVFAVSLFNDLRRLQEAHEKEVSALKVQLGYLQRNLDVAVSRFEKRISSLESERKELESKLSARELEIHLIPRIGTTLVVTGVLKNSKMGWYLAVDQFDASIRFRKKTPNWTQLDERSLERLNGKKVVVTGVVNFDSGRDSKDATLNRFSGFYFDPTESRIEAVEAKR